MPPPPRSGCWVFAAAAESLPPRPPGRQSQATGVGTAASAHAHLQTFLDGAAWVLLSWTWIHTDVSSSSLAACVVPAASPCSAAASLQQRHPGLHHPPRRHVTALSQCRCAGGSQLLTCARAHSLWPPYLAPLPSSPLHMFIFCFPVPWQ